MAVRRNTKSSPGFTIFFGLIWVVVAIVMFSVGTGKNNMRKRCTESTTGVVQSVRMERRSRKSGKHSRTTYYVYVTGYEFEADGKEYSGSSTLSESQRLEIGSTLRVSYNPSNPEKDHFSNYDNSGTGGIAVAIFLGVIGIIVVISGFREKARLGGSGFSRAAASGTGVVLNGMNNNNNYDYNNYNNNFNNGYNNNYNNNNYNNNYNNNNNNNYNGYNNNNGYSNNNYDNGYNNNYNNNYNNGYNNNYNNSYNNNNVYSGGNDYNDFNQLN